MRPVIGRARIGKSMSGARVRMKLVSFAPAGEFRTQLAHIFGRRVLVLRAEVSLNGAANLPRPVKRRCTVAKRHHRATAVKHHAGFETPTRRRHEIDEPSAHAKADDAQSSAVDLPVIFQKLHRRGYVL